MPQRQNPIAIFDRKLVRQHRERAAGNFQSYDFLLRRAADEIAERISGINRDFPIAADIGTHQGALSDALSRTPTFSHNIEMLVSGDLSLSMLQRVEGVKLGLDEEALPFRTESLNLITSILSLHWVNDLPGALLQIRRALKPDGLFIGALFGGETLRELRQSLAEAEIEMEGGLSPRISPFADMRDIGGLLQRAGFTLPVVDTDRVTVRYQNPFKLLADLRGMGETNALTERRRTPLRRSTLMQAMAIYQEKFALEDGRVPATFDIVIATGWAAHETQQKPLKPGSAEASLADALSASGKNGKR